MPTNLRVQATPLPDVLILEPRVFEDERGYFQMCPFGTRTLTMPEARDCVEFAGGTKPACEVLKCAGGNAACTLLV